MTVTAPTFLVNAMTVLPVSGFVEHHRIIFMLTVAIA
jgi:hypothetical protein